jgi:hypothetical protein
MWHGLRKTLIPSVNSDRRRGRKRRRRGICRALRVSAVSARPGLAKGDLAAALMQKLESDEELAFACQALDWGTGPIMVPERYGP